MPKLPTLLGPFILLVLYFSLALFVRGKISNPETFIESIKDFYETYGYSLIFFGAILEASFLIGFYVPGATVVLFGAALSKTGVVEFPLVFLLGTLGLCSGYVLNYFLGKYGLYHVLTHIGLKKGVEEAKVKIEQYGKKAIMIGYFFPGSASFLSTAAGILRMPFKTFLFVSLLSQGFWSLLWGGLAYFFGLPLVEFFLKYFVFVLLGVIIFWFVRKLVTKK